MESQPPIFALRVTVQALRVEPRYSGTGDAVPLLNSFDRSYILGTDSSDSDGRVRSRVGEDITELLRRLTNEQIVWEGAKVNAQADAANGRKASTQAEQDREGSGTSSSR